MIEARKAKGIAKPNDMVIKTIVTTDMIDVLKPVALVVTMYSPVSNGFHR